MSCLQFLRKCRQPEAKSACSGWTWPTFSLACNQCFLQLEEDKLDINSHRAALLSSIPSVPSSTLYKLYNPVHTRHLCDLESSLPVCLERSGLLLSHGLCGAGVFE